ncbi:hypothetical protein T05_14105 [Trichinella murrelli]|uniref:Uncharacterized protein n=1 Tax=Trichinella murrelli TaxID=144512 RepID=A0A0V0U4I0_9BILA|nr:hypothetical protein T05_14105 [Trichinella murrelli]
MNNDEMMYIPVVVHGLASPQLKYSIPYPFKNALLRHTENANEVNVVCYSTRIGYLLIVRVFDDKKLKAVATAAATETGINLVRFAIKICKSF